LTTHQSYQTLADVRHAMHQIDSNEWEKRDEDDHDNVDNGGDYNAAADDDDDD